MNNIKILKAGYDGLDVSFKGTLSPRVLALLERAKKQAQNDKREATLRLTPRLLVRVAETGAKGGYAFRVDTGPEGETWFFKNSDREDWNIRCSCKSSMLATLGYEGAKARLYERLWEFSATVSEESIGRVDFAFDFTLPGFAINPALVVAHAHSGVNEDGVSMDRAMAAVSPDECEVSNITSIGRRVQTVTIGRMPGRQVTVYDKTAEVKKRGKSWWWQLWRVAEDTQVWRLEVRAGKKYLKERVGVTTWADLEAKMPDIIHATLVKIRMADPEKVLHERNISRTGYHPVWMAALNYVRMHWRDTLKRVEPVRIITGERRKVARMFEQLVQGTVISYAAACGVERAEVPRFIAAVMRRTSALPNKDARAFAKKWRKSNEKYEYLTGCFTGWSDAYAAG